MNYFAINLQKTKNKKMITRIFYLFIVLIVAVACNNTQNAGTDDATTTNEETATITEITVANFIADAGTYAGQEVTLTGLVNHTCKHGGQRMFIIDEETEETVKIEAGENIDSFEAELEGSVVVVRGIVKEMVIDESYLNDWEKEVMEGETEELKIHDGKHEGEGNEEGEGGEEGEETEEDHHGSDLEKIENLRTMLKESEKDHLSFYSIECIEYEIAPPPPPQED